MEDFFTLTTQIEDNINRFIGNVKKFNIIPEDTYK